MLIFIILFYVLPLIFVYFNRKAAYSKGGEREHLEPDMLDLQLTIFPILNIVAVVIIVCKFIRKRSLFSNKLISKFFGIKK